MPCPVDLSHDTKRLQVFIGNGEGGEEGEEGEGSLHAAAHTRTFTRWLHKALGPAQGWRSRVKGVWPIMVVRVYSSIHIFVLLSRQ